MMNSKPKPSTTKENAKPSLVPKLRFPEFRGTEGWEQSELGRNATILKGKGISKADLDPSGSQACIRYGELYTRYGETIRKAVSRTNLPVQELFLSMPDDVIMPSSGETKIDIAKASCVLTGGIALGGDLNVIRSKFNGIFLSYLLNGSKRFEIAKVAQGDAVVHLYPHQLEVLQIEFPSIPEQHRIASCLSSLDDLITAQAKKIDLLKTYKKGLMQQLFPREGETQPRLRFPEFRGDGEWEEGELGLKACKVGSGITPKGGDKNYKQAGRPFVRSQNIGWGVLLLDDVAYIDEETHASFESTEIKEGDVLLNITGASIGRSAVADERIAGGNVNQHVCIIRTEPEQLSPFYLNQYLIAKEGQKQIDSFQAGGNRQGLNFAQIRSLVIPQPPSPAEQHRIASCLSSLDALITTETQKHEALKTHKNGLMQGLFPSAELN